MNKMALLVIMHFVVVENVNNTDVVLSMTEGSFFKQINSNLDNMTHKLFNNLKLDQNYTQSSKIKLLKLIHESLRNVSESNFRIYNDIKNASKSKYDNKTIDALFNLTNIIDEIFRILEFNSDVAVEVVVNEFDSTKAIFKTLKSMKNDTDSEGMIGMMKFFIERKDSKLTKQRARKKKKYRKRKKNKWAHHGFSRKIFYNLKPWRPSRNLSELELSTANRRIYKGKKAKLRRFPFIVSIHVMGEFLCSGSIINRDLIITSASCLQMAYNDQHLLDNPNAITIRAGSELTRRDGVVVPVIEIYYHPMYDPLYLANNLAIARIQTEITDRNDAKIRRIEFDKLKAKLPESGQVTILGWGDKDSYTRYAGPLTMAQLEVYGLEPCKEIYSENYVQDTNFCAGFVTVGGGACNKDIGGPGLVDSLLVGVISFGPPVCGTRDAPTVFTKLGFYSEWIEYVMKKVLRTPYKNSPPVAFRQASNNSEMQNQQQLSKSNPSEVLALKKLFKDYILSGKMDIKELIPDESKGSVYAKTKYDDGLNDKISASKPAVDNNAPEFRPHELEQNIDFNKIHSAVKAHATNTKDNNYIHDLSASLDDDGEPKSNSLTDNYDNMNPHSMNRDEETEEGLSIDMGYTDKTRTTLRANINKDEQRIRPMSSIKEPSTFKEKKIEVKTNFSKRQKFGLMEGGDPTTAKQTVFEISNTLDINVERLDIPPSLMKMFLRRGDPQPTTELTVTPSINLRRDVQDPSSDSESDSDSNFYDNLKYIV